MRKQTGFIHIHIVAILFGLPGLFGKLLALDPAAITMGRAAFAALALFVAAKAMRVSLSLRHGLDRLRCLLGGALLAAHWYTFFLSIQVSSVAVGLLSYSSFPLFVVFLEPLFFREKFRRIELLLALSTTAGLALIPAALALNDRVTQGILWGVASALLFALLSLLNRSQVRAHSPIAVAFHQDLCAALFLAPAVLRWRHACSGRDWVLLALLGVVFTAGAHTLFIASLRHIRAQLASIVVSLEPIYGTFFALLLLGEVPSTRTLLGGALIVASVFLAMWLHTNQAAIDPRPSVSDGEAGG